MNRWTDGEIGVLIAFGRKLPDSRIAQQLGRTVAAVKSKRAEIGLLKLDESTLKLVRIPAEQPDEKPTTIREL